MNAQAWIAVYAAVIATGALSWQVLIFWNSGRQQVALDAFLLIIKDPIPVDIIFWSMLRKQQERAESIEFVLQLRIINMSKNRLQITRVWLRQADRSGNVSMWDTTIAASAPFWLDSREERIVLLDNFDLNGYSFDQEGEAIVEAAGGKKSFAVKVPAQKEGFLLVNMDRIARWERLHGGPIPGNSIDIGSPPRSQEGKDTQSDKS